jgi:arginyl-tRNA--protein-N-Asp/Glu arginylyltransferase
MTAILHQLLLYQSPPHPCGYLEGRTASSVFVDPDAELDPSAYGALLNQGFRRSGTHVYRPACPECQACVAARIPVDAFEPRRSQRRTWKANQDLTTKITLGRFDEEHFALYQAYTAQRHEDGEMAKVSAEEYHDFLVADWCATQFLEVRLDGRLVAVAVTDRVPKGLSALYTFFDPALKERSLGVFAILRQIDWARSEGLPYVYLGYWIGNCRKMAYKEQYRPLELLVGRRWQRFAADQPLPVEEAE